MEVFYQTTGILVTFLMARSQISFSSWEIEHLGSKKFLDLLVVFQTGCFFVEDIYKPKVFDNLTWFD